MIRWNSLHADWHRLGSCRDHDTDLFFPAPGRSAEPAKRICADCPVVQRCAEWALADHGLDGVLGGMTAAERDQQRRRAA